MSGIAGLPCNGWAALDQVPEPHASADRPSVGHDVAPLLARPPSPALCSMAADRLGPAPSSTPSRVPVAGSRDRQRRPLACWPAQLFRWDFRRHHGCADAIEVIGVTQQTVLTGHAAGVAALADVLFYLSEIGHESARVALLVALQIGPAFFKAMAGQAASILQDTQMWLMDEVRDAFMFDRDRSRGEIDEAPFTGE